MSLYDVAKEKGLTTAASLWPVIAGSKIDYNLAETFPSRIWINQVLVSLKASGPLFLHEMNKKYGELRHGIKQPGLDDFVTACTVDTIKNKKLDLTLIHLVDMDGMRHRYGVRSPQAKEVLYRLDKRVVKIIQTTKDTGAYAQADFMILGDHYQINVGKTIHLNMLFAQQGLLHPLGKKNTYRNNGQVTAKTCDGETYIYIRGAVDRGKTKQMIAGVEGIERIYDKAAVTKRGGRS